MPLLGFTTCALDTRLFSVSCHRLPWGRKEIRISHIKTSKLIRRVLKLITGLSCTLQIKNAVLHNKSAQEFFNPILQLQNQLRFFFCFVLFCFFVLFLLLFCFVLFVCLFVCLFACLFVCLFGWFCFVFCFLFLFLFCFLYKAAGSFSLFKSNVKDFFQSIAF